jgi:hypothetical protein
MDTQTRVLHAILNTERDELVTGKGKMKMQRYKAGERRHKRHLFFQKIEYSLGSRSHDDIYDGLIINVSEAGMCMYADVPLPEGENIEIVNALPVSSQKATIRWVEKYLPDLYKIGLVFVGCKAVS